MLPTAIVPHPFDQLDHPVMPRRDDVQKTGRRLVLPRTYFYLENPKWFAIPI